MSHTVDLGDGLFFELTWVRRSSSRDYENSGLLFTFSGKIVFPSGKARIALNSLELYELEGDGIGVGSASRHDSRSQRTVYYTAFGPGNQTDAEQFKWLTDLTDAFHTACAAFADENDAAYRQQQANKPQNTTRRRRRPGQ